ncbi:replication initiator [Saccharopolyspora sp. NPDC050642]|uniref:replication initiator n=1 Tax=Saccharopolyspora sp. NPDC050642 TaxID=3157099 RepID=UPI0033DDEB64
MARDNGGAVVDDNGGESAGTALRRLRGPRGLDVAVAVAEAEGVCGHPVVLRRTNLDTGESRLVGIACGSRRGSVCGPCAMRNKRLRETQLAEGWHLNEEPDIGPREPDEGAQSVMAFRADLLGMGLEAKASGNLEELEEIRADLADVDRQLREDHDVRGKLPGLDDEDQDETKPRRVRSTRRRQDAPDLPRKPVQNRTIGREYAGKYRPSMMVTTTLDSYGAVHSAYVRDGRVQRCACGKTHKQDAAFLGTPVDPKAYDYRRHARDAVHFAAQMDRFFQNLRRAVGWKVQYFAAIESQRRLAPHAHIALRGSIPRDVIKQVAAATYHQVWWPEHGDPVYGGRRVPVWVPERSAWCDPDTREPLRSFEDALPGEDDDPAHVVRFGNQVDIRGVLGGTEEANRHIKYLTKYVTKSVGETYADASEAHRQHADWLLAELAVTPCSPRCPVWLLHGIQPQGAHSRMNPGQCKGNAHKRETLGVAGRRVLVSRAWTGKRLSDHQTDRQEHVRGVLNAAGLPVVATDAEQKARVAWEPVSPTDPDAPSRALLILQAVAERRRWKAQYQQAQTLLAGPRAAPGGRAGDGGGPA